MSYDDLRGKVAVATKILTKERLIGPFGHPSARVPGTGLVAILGHTRDHVSDLAATGADDVILVDLNGAVADDDLGEDRSAPGERFIHTEIYRARPDVNAVVHAHPMGCIAFSIAGRPILPIWNLCTQVRRRRARLRVGSADRHPELGRDLAAALGGHSAALLKGHGAVVTGGSIQEATVSAVNLERSARLQLMVEGIGEPGDTGSELNDESLTVGLSRREYVDANGTTGPPRSAGALDAHWATEVGR